jgi:hypothetical protein
MLHFYCWPHSERERQKRQNLAAMRRECGKISSSSTTHTHAIYKQCISHMRRAVGFLLFFPRLRHRAGSQYFILFISRHVPSVLGN